MIVQSELLPVLCVQMFSAYSCRDCTHLSLLTRTFGHLPYVGLICGSELFKRQGKFHVCVQVLKRCQENKIKRLIFLKEKMSRGDIYLVLYILTVKILDDEKLQVLLK